MMTGIETIIILNSVIVVANTVVLFFNNKIIGKALDNNAKFN